jgi:hypothetical protein
VVRTVLVEGENVRYERKIRHIYLLFTAPHRER